MPSFLSFLLPRGIGRIGINGNITIRRFYDHDSVENLEQCNTGNDASRVGIPVSFLLHLLADTMLCRMDHGMVSTSQETLSKTHDRTVSLTLIPSTPVDMKSLQATLLCLGPWKLRAIY